MSVSALSTAPPFNLLVLSCVLPCLVCSHYPNNRVSSGKDNAPKGVPGSVELLNSRVISTQPIVSLDWSPDREGLCALTCLDQTLRVYIVTKLHKY